MKWAASFAVFAREKERGQECVEPLSMSAEAKRPLEEGITRCLCTDDAPALWPKIITRLLSPPKTCAWRWTHRSADCWSCSPQFPVPEERARERSSAKAVKPSTPRR